MKKILIIICIREIVTEIISLSQGISFEKKSTYLKHSTFNEIPLSLPLQISTKPGPFHVSVMGTH